MPEETVQTGLSDNAASGLAYLTFIPAIIFLAVPPYNQSPTVRFHSWQSIFLAIAWFAVWVVLVVVGMIPFVNFLDVIDAERTVLQSRRAAVQLAGVQAAATVNLIRALGGGWGDAVTPPGEATMAQR